MNSFTGDVAIQALRRRLSLEPDAVPQPPIVVRREPPFPWIARLGFVCLAAGLAAFGITALSVTDLYSPLMNKSDRVDSAGIHAGSTERTTASTWHRPAWSSRAARAAANESGCRSAFRSRIRPAGKSVFLSGLENGTRLTAGTPFGSKGWRISARDLGSVLAYAPVDYIGAMHAAINLHAANNAVVDTRVVDWNGSASPSRSRQASNRRSSGPQRSAAPLAPTAVRSWIQEEIGRLIQRGQQLLQSGDIAPARLMLQRAAHGGSAQAALVLGGTYDPEVLREIGRPRVCARTRPRPASGTKRRWNSAPAKPAVASIAWRRRNASSTMRGVRGGQAEPPRCLPAKSRASLSSRQSRNGTLLSPNFSSRFASNRH